jgi:HEAT repeat protein/GTPase SAR1 family protein
LWYADKPDLNQSNNMSDNGLIFISYKREDETFARQLREQLHAWGWRTWMDIFDIPKGAYWPDEIQKGLESADSVVGILSPNSVQSRNVKNEWDWSIVYKKRLILLMVENCIVPMNYVSLNWIEYHKAPDTAYIQLKTALEVGKPVIGSANITLEPVTLSATATVTTPDPYQDYLQKLYERLNKALAQRVIKRKDENSQEAEPLHLRSSSTPEAVDELFAKQDEIDPLFEAMGIANEVLKQDFDDFESAFEFYEGQVLLLGEPGAGKTITLLQFARDKVVQRIQDPTRKLPMFAILPEWLQKEMPDIPQWMAQTYAAAHDAAKLVHDGNALLILDGLDELGNERPVDPEKPEQETFNPRIRFLELLQDVSGGVNNTTNQIVVSCRTEDYKRIGLKIGLKGAVTLKKLDETQISTYLEDIPGLQEVFANDFEMQKIAETPLLLSLIAYSFRDKPKQIESLRDLKEGGLRDTIFNAYIDERFAHEQRKLPKGHRSPLELETLRRNLGWIAMINATGSYNATENVLMESDFWRVVGSYKSSTFIAFCQQLNLITTVDKQSWRFVHLKLRDTLANGQARALIHDLIPKLRRIASSALGHIGDASAIPLLVEALSDSDGNVRLSAVLALGQIGDPTVIPAISQRLLDGNATVRRGAATALGQVGNSSAISILANVLNDTKKDVRRSAAMSLGQIKDRAALPALLVAINDVNAEVRSSVAIALGQIGDSTTIPSLVIALSDITRAVRRSAAIALGQIGEREAIPALVKSLSDSRPTVRSVSAIALGQIGEREAIPALLNALSDVNSEVRSSAVAALRQIDYSVVLPTLMTFMHNANGVTRVRMASMLWYIGETAALSEILKDLHNQNGAIRLSAVAALSKIADPITIPDLVTALDDMNPTVRGSAAAALGHIGDSRPLLSLVKVLKDSDQNVRSSAAEALGNIKAEEAVPALFRALYDKSVDVRQYAATALARIGSPSIPLLLKALQDENSNIRYNAATALAKIREPSTIPLLLKSLNDTSKEVRGRVAFAIEQIGDADSIPYLKVLLKDITISKIVAHALNGIGNEDALRLVHISKMQGHNMKDEWQDP